MNNKHWALDKLGETLAALDACSQYNHPQGTPGLEEVKQKICLCVGWLMAQKDMERKIIIDEKP